MRLLLLTTLMGLLLPYNSFSTSPKEDLKLYLKGHISRSDLFRYPAETFQSRTRRILTPTILIEGGAFSCRRISSGRGGLAINLKDGRIDLEISDSGTYEITYNVNGASQTVTITLS